MCRRRGGSSQADATTYSNTTYLITYLLTYVRTCMHHVVRMNTSKRAQHPEQSFARSLSVFCGAGARWEPRGLTVSANLA